MKIARYVSIGMLGFFIVSSRATADPAGSDPGASPYTQYDPDGVPLAVTHPQPQRLTPAQIDEIQKEEKQAALDKDWLLRNYEKQLRVRAAKSSEDQSANLYYQLSSNRDLAKLAGLPALDSDEPDSTTTYRTGTPLSGPGSAPLRAGSPPPATGGSLSHGNLFKPLITPLSAPEAAGLHNFYFNLAPLPGTSPISGGPPRTSVAPKADQSMDSSDLETPGMVASEKDPLMDAGAPDLTLDMLPGESIAQAKAHQDNTTKLELPLPMDVAQLHKAQAVVLTVPGAPNAAQAATPTPAPTAPIENPDDAPIPVSKEPQINPVRSPIANPYDILNR